MSEFTNENDRPVLILDDKPCKSMEQLLIEGRISPQQFRSLLFLMQAGYGFSSTPQDAAFIQKGINALSSSRGTVAESDDLIDAGE